MRIIVTTGLYPPEIGGPATYTKLLEERLPKHGVEVDVLAFKEVRHLPLVVRHIVFMWKTFRKARSADLVLLQDTVSTGLPARIAGLLARKPTVLRVPGDYAWEQGKQRFGVKDDIDRFQIKRHGLFVELLRTMQKWVTKSAHKVIAPSEYLAGIVRGWGRHDVNVIYNGVEFPIPVTKPNQNIKRPLIVSVGRLVPWKGFSELIDVVAENSSQHLVIIGEGPERNVLEHLIQERNIGDRVWLSGQLPRKEMHGWIEAADVFVLNSAYEGLSHVLIEALALGTPVVATKIGGNPEVITSRKEGMLIEPYNKEALKDAIQNALMGNQVDKDSMRERAKEFSIDSTVSQLVALFRSCIS